MSLSVIIPTFNQADLLPRCLDAIFSQDLLPEEVIVIDDASTDETQIVLSRYRKNPQLKVVRNQKNVGPALSMNQILNNARGKYLAFCASDDYVFPEFFKNAISVLEKYPDIAICSGDHAVFFSEKSHQINPIKTLKMDCSRMFSPSEVQQLFKKTALVIPTHASIFRKSKILEKGPFFLELKGLCDWFLNISCALEYGLAYIPMVFAAMRIAPESYGSNTNKRRAQRKEILDHLFKILEEPQNCKLKNMFKDCYLFSHLNYRFFYELSLMPKYWNLTLPSFPYKLKRVLMNRFSSKV